MPPGDDALDPEFRLAETAAQANEWALVLFSAGIPFRVVRAPHGFALQVSRKPLNSLTFPLRRGGRAVEGGGLESRAREVARWAELQGFR
jgi:hypothetical protein